jgi:hypothetical protein
VISSLEIHQFENFSLTVFQLATNIKDLCGNSEPASLRSLVPKKRSRTETPSLFDHLPYAEAHSLPSPKRPKWDTQFTPTRPALDDLFSPKSQDSYFLRDRAMDSLAWDDYSPPPSPTPTYDDEPFSAGVRRGGGRYSESSSRGRYERERKEHTPRTTPNKPPVDLLDSGQPYVDFFGFSRAQGSFTDASARKLYKGNIL